MVGLLRGVITHYPTTMSTTLQQLNNVYYPTSLSPYSLPAALLHSLHSAFLPHSKHRSLLKVQRFPVCCAEWILDSSAQVHCASEWSGCTGGGRRWFGHTVSILPTACPTCSKHADVLHCKAKIQCNTDNVWQCAILCSQGD